MFADIIASLFDSSEARIACNALTRSAEETSWEASNAALAALAIERESVSDISGDMGRYPSAGRDAMTIAVVEVRNQNPIRTRLLLPSVCSKLFVVYSQNTASIHGRLIKDKYSPWSLVLLPSTPISCL